MKLFYSLLIIIFLSPNASFSKNNSNIEYSDRYSALLVDKNAKKILYQKNARDRRFPASLTKVMTLYMLFNALENNELTLNQKLRVSAHAASQPRSNLDLKEGEFITVRQAINALIIKSANDVAVVIAEKLSKSEKNFAKDMNRQARKLGMLNTHFTNASGLPDPKQYTNAVDMVKLTLQIQRNFPQFFHFFSNTAFTFKGKEIKSYNKVTKNYAAATGLKTGYIKASGYNLITTTKTNNGELIAVVFGGDSSAARDKHMMALLDYGHGVLKSKNHYANKSNDKTPFYSTSAFSAAVQSKVDRKTSAFKALRSY